MEVFLFDILTQIAAVQSALDKVALELLNQHARHCLDSEAIGSGKDQKINELVKVVARMI